MPRLDMYRYETGDKNPTLLIIRKICGFTI